MGTIEKGRGRFVWFDLNTTDLPGAIAFYTKVVGWGTQLWGPDYTMFTAQGAPAERNGMGGVVPLSADAKAMGAPPSWVGYIGTPDCDATTKKAVSLGATVLMPPFDIPGVGRFAILADPQGAVFSPFTPQGEAPGSEAAAVDGEVGWHELATTDPDAALAFYGELFGWTPSEVSDLGPLGKYQMFKRPGAKNSTGAIYAKPEGMPVSNWLYYVRVPDLKASIAAIEANGGQIKNGPMDVPGGDTIVIASDPQGAMFALFQHTGSAA